MPWGQGRHRETETVVVASSFRAVKHVRTLNAEIKRASTMTEEELYTYAKVGFPYSSSVPRVRSVLTDLVRVVTWVGHSSALPSLEGDCQAQATARCHVSQSPAPPTPPLPDR